MKEKKQCIHLGYACGEFFCVIDKGKVCEIDYITLRGKKETQVAAYSYPEQLCEGCEYLTFHKKLCVHAIAISDDLISCIYSYDRGTIFCSHIEKECAGVLF